MSLLPPAPQLIAFVAASAVLAVTPGPGVVYIVTRTLAQGRRAGLASVAGVALGNFASAAVASTGLALVLATSAWAFACLKYAGAAYLCVLGWRAWHQVSARSAIEPSSVERGQVLGQGFFVALLNPKTVLFFAAFLPAFMQGGDAPLAQALMLGALFVGVAAASDTGYVVLASTVATKLRDTRDASMRGQRVAALVYIGLGCVLAWSGVDLG